LVDGVVAMLIDAVLPDCATPFARAQLYAAVDVLRNLRDRVEPRADLAEAESESAAAALAGAIAAVGAASPLGVRLAAQLEAVPASPPAARVTALRAALVDALTLIAMLPEGTARAARMPIAQHLGAQAMRDVAVLKPSMLGEISRG
jgi:hypothetical protein